MLKFVWCYMTAAFAILFAFQSIGMTVMGDYMMFVGMLCLSFVLIKDDRIKEMIASNICLAIVILTLWFSEHTFHYIQNTGMLLLLVPWRLLNYSECSGGGSLLVINFKQVLYQSLTLR